MDSVDAVLGRLGWCCGLMDSVDAVLGWLGWCCGLMDSVDAVLGWLGWCCGLMDSADVMLGCRGDGCCCCWHGRDGRDQRLHHPSRVMQVIIPWGESCPVPGGGPVSPVVAGGLPG